VLLADMGADVVKVEEPRQGDPFRGWGRGGYSPTFRSVNRGKRSLGLDLRTDDGRALLLELAESADVLVENHRPGVAERLGFGYDALASRNPRLVYCSISGFGSSGPYRDRPGYDTVGQAVSGLLSLLTDLERPLPMGISLSDHLTGLTACYGILVALVSRGATVAAVGSRRRCSRRRPRSLPRTPRGTLRRGTSRRARRAHASRRRTRSWAETACRS
jgi:crotonobetainyl-CoA:carnitine CoA-transferase CaiB-like acyl-CoA transferase